MSEKKSLPLISIVVPSFNQAFFLKAALDSILNQNYPHCEILVMDAQSTDGSVEILKSYGSKIRWISEKDRGQSDALNQGFGKTTGEIVGWLNSDDRCEPGALQAVGNFFAENPETQWAFGHCRMINSQGRDTLAWISAYKAFKLKRYSFKAHLVGNFVSQMGVFVRRKALEEAGGVNETLYYAMDYDLWLRLGKKHRPGYIPRVLGSFRVYETSKSMSNFRKRFTEDYAIALEHAQGVPGAGWILAKHRLSNALLATMYRVMQSLKRNASS